MLKLKPKFFVAGLLVSALVTALPVLAQSSSNRALEQQAFVGAQWVLATQAARAIAQVGARAAAGDGPLAEKIRLRQTKEANLAAQRKLLIDAIAQSSPQVPQLRGDVSQLTEDMEQLDRQIAVAFPKYAELSNPRPMTYDQVQQLLGPKEAIALFLPDRTGTYVWGITRDGSVWHRSGLSSQALSLLVRRVRLDLDPTGTARSAVSLSQPTGPRLASFDADAAHQLYRELVAPLMTILEDVDHLYVVKDGPLGSLPLSVLLATPLDSETPDADALRSADWLLHAFALTTLPAVSSLSTIHGGNARPERPMRFAGFGNPTFSSDGAAPTDLMASRSIDAFFDGSGARLDAIRALAPLPGTAKELTQIAQLFPKNHVALALGENATEQAVKSADLSEVSIVSFATHGLITGDISGLAEPALAFTPPSIASPLDDGLLTASEASALKLDADWVILSACNTAASDGAPGAEGLSGLARAFLFAGAQSILVSHWPVRDDVAAMLTSGTLRRLNNDPSLPRSKALQQAIQAVMLDETDPSLAHPSAWAPFVLVGAGRLQNQ